MPRGNDSDAALKDLANKFGKGTGNADDLIEMNLASRPQELAKAEMLPRDEVKTAAVMRRLDDFKGPDGEKVVSAAVRGEQIVIVYVDSYGGHRLGVLDEHEKPIRPRKPQHSKDG